MNVYENIVIFDGSLSDEAIEEATKKITDLIAGQQGEVLKVDHWGKRRMAYEINKRKRGFFTLFLFKAPGSLIKKLEDHYRVTDAVVKYMVVALQKKQEEATLRAIQKEKEAATSGKEETASGEEKES
jgi:small subunit ribosomal protein S6